MISEALRDWFEARHGGIVRAEDRSWSHGVTRVFELWTASEHLWLKQHTQARKFDQELSAYLQWVPVLAEAGERAPGLIDREPALRALVLTHLDGEPAPGDDPAIHRQAGAALAALHAAPFVDHDPLTVREAILARLERWSREAAGLVPAEVVARVNLEIGDAEVFAGARRVPCHRDFSPRNWLVHEGRFGLLDFEHAAPDLRWVDVMKLADDTWRLPGTRDAFLDAYGRGWSEVDAQRIERLSWLHALSTWVWSAAHDDAAYLEHARRHYARLVGV
ncbi:MAG: phosphotransferase [Myxococcales bacterium]|nr:phosphotransferase [Myxococcales bacterium]